MRAKFLTLAWNKGAESVSAEDVQVAIVEKADGTKEVASWVEKRKTRSRPSAASRSTRDELAGLGAHWPGLDFGSHWMSPIPSPSVGRQTLTQVTVTIEVADATTANALQKGLEATPTAELARTIGVNSDEIADTNASVSSADGEGGGLDAVMLGGAAGSAAAGACLLLLCCCYCQKKQPLANGALQTSTGQLQRTPAGVRMWPPGIAAAARLLTASTRRMLRSALSQGRRLLPPTSPHEPRAAPPPASPKTFGHPEREQPTLRSSHACHLTTQSATWLST